MSNSALQSLIDQAFEDRAAIDARTRGDVRDAVEKALTLLDSGEARVAEKSQTRWAPGRGKSTNG